MTAKGNASKEHAFSTPRWWLHMPHVLRPSHTHKQASTHRHTHTDTHTDTHTRRDTHTETYTRRHKHTHTQTHTHTHAHTHTHTHARAHRRTHTHRFSRGLRELFGSDGELIYSAEGPWPTYTSRIPMCTYVRTYVHAYVCMYTCCVCVLSIHTYIPT